MENTDLNKLLQPWVEMVNKKDIELYIARLEAGFRLNTLDNIKKLAINLKEQGRNINLDMLIEQIDFQEQEIKRITEDYIKANFS